MPQKILKSKSAVSRRFQQGEGPRSDFENFAKDRFQLYSTMAAPDYIMLPYIALCPSIQPTTLGLFSSLHVNGEGMVFCIPLFSAQCVVNNSAMNIDIFFWHWHWHDGMGINQLVPLFSVKAPTNAMAAMAFLNPNHLATTYNMFYV